MSLHTFRRPFARHAVAHAVLVLCGTALAGPEGGRVVAGQAQIAQQGSTTTIQQQSARAAIDWNSFNIGAAETVRFVQPDASSVTLNRVLGNDPTAIFGRLSANGQVLLVNPNGVLFGRSAQVDVGGLVATTANITNADFMAGRLSFTEPGRPGAKVENLGTITVAQAGLAALVAPYVANSGVVQARLGRVALAAGDAFVLDLHGDRLINLVLPPHALATLTDTDGRPLAARLDQNGHVSADGGRVELSAASVAGLLDSVINVGGVVRATSFDVAPGHISLLGDAGTRMAISGRLDASGSRGGDIAVTAREVRVAAGARLDAGGDAAGGSVQLGGGWQGGGPLAHAQLVQVERGAVIDASARGSGSGGTVSVWSAGDTRFEGRVQARGGAAGGDGGRVEVSGARRLGFDGDVDAGAAYGRAGSLLLDPTNLVVVASGGQDTLPPADAGGDFTVRATAVSRQLVNGTSVTLQASQDITVAADAVIDGRLAQGGTAGGGLSLEAGRDVLIDGLVILNGGSFAATAGRHLAQAPASAIATLGGAIDLSAGGTLTASNLLTTGAVTLASSGAGVRVTEAIGSAAARVASLDVQGATGVTLEKGALVAGAVNLAADAGAVDTGGATIDAAGLVALAGTRIAAGAIVTPGAVRATGANGVTLGAVSGAAGAVDATTATATGLTVKSDGDVTLDGAALGDGGLLVEGLAADTRAGSLSLAGGSVFSSGVITARTGAITLTAGLAGADRLTLDASGSLTTGSGALRSAGAATLSAGGALLLGSGGLEVTGNASATLTAGGSLQTQGDLRSAGDVALAGDGITVAGKVNAAAYTARSSAAYTQTGTIAAGLVSVDSRTALRATNVVSPGTVALTSREADIVVSGPLAGGASLPLQSLVATGQTGVTLQGGVLASGAVTLVSAAGPVDASAASVQGGGAVTLQGASIRAGAVITPGAVVATSAGDVSLGAVAGAIDSEGSVDSGTAPVSGLTVRSGGTVTLAGAAIGVDGLLVEGPDAGTRAGALTLAGGSVFSEGPIGVRAGAITLDAGLRSGGTLTLDAAAALASGSGKLESALAASLSSGTSLLLGSGGLEAGAAVTLASGGSLQLTGDLRAVGAVALSGNGITLAGEVNAGAFSADSGGAYTQTAAIAAASIDIDARGALRTTALATPGAVVLTSREADVVVGAAVAAAAAQPASSLHISAQTGITLGGGARTAGSTRLEAAAGALDTRAGTLQSGGAVTLGGTSVAAGAIVTPGSVTVTSRGNVSLGAVAGAAGSVDAATVPAAGLVVKADGSVTLAGAALGSGGLQVGGTAEGSRAAALDVTGGSLFSDGAITARAGAITLASGLQTDGVLTLDASGALATGAGKLQSAGAATLTAGSTLVLGSGGLQVTGSAAATLGAGTALQTQGDVTSAGAVALNGAGVTVQGQVNAAAFTADSSATYTQTATVSGSSIDIDSRGALRAASLITPGAVMLASREADVVVVGVVAAGTASPVQSLTVSAPTGIRLAGGAQVAGATSLVSSGGAIDTAAATLQSGADITLSGTTVATGALVTPGAVDVAATGAVSLGAVTGAVGAVTSGATPAVGLTVRTPGAVTLAGAAFGSGGLLVEGPTGGSRAGSLVVDGASIFSGALVLARTTGDIRFGGAAGLQVDGPVVLDAGGALTSGSAALVALSSLLGVAGGPVTIGSGGASAGGDMELRSSGNLLATGPLRTAGGTMTLRSTAGSVTLGEIFTWQTLAQDSGKLQVEAATDVVLEKPLGGADTGYRLLADGYRPDLNGRPEVGAVEIVAGGTVMLNGLNLDGRSDGPAGLAVEAGHRIVSNGAIGVNKGNIVLQVLGGATPADTDGIYLGNSVYSRGLDLGAQGKTAYGISIGGQGAEGTRGRLFLFDNTDDQAFVPDYFEIAKIVVANNVANYRRADAAAPGGFVDDPALVEAGNAAGVQVAIGADDLRTLTVAPGPLSLSTMPRYDQTTSSLGDARILRADQTVAQGISLKVQTFRGADDASTQVTTVRGTDDIVTDGPASQCSDGLSSCYARSYFRDGDGTLYSLADVSGTTWVLGDTPQDEPRSIAVNAFNLAPETGFDGAIAFVMRNGGQGRVAGFANRIAGYAPSVQTRLDQNSPQYDSDADTWTYFTDGTVGYAQFGRLVQLNDAGDPNRVSRVLFAPGKMATETQVASFNISGGLNSGNGDIVGNSGSGLGGAANSNAGFTSVGSFGQPGTTTVTGAAGGRAGVPDYGSLLGTSAAGVTGPGTVDTGFGTLPPASGSGASGNASPTTVAFGGLAGTHASGAVGNGFTLPPAGTLPPPDTGGGGSGGGGGGDNGSGSSNGATASDTLRPVVEGALDTGAGSGASVVTLVLGGRPAALADLGRGSAAAGAAPNVFRTRFRVARTQDNSVCAPSDVEPAGGGDRTCAPAP